MNRLDLVSLGECLIEFSLKEQNGKLLAFRSLGSSSFNPLVTAARLGASVGYIARFGKDALGRYLLNFLQKEKIDISQIRLVEGFNALYFILRLPEGEREFLYYRKGSAGSTLCPDDIDEEYIKKTKIIHSTGTTQAISLSSRKAVYKAFSVAWEAGINVSFDPNLRLGLWNIEDARGALNEILPFIDILLPALREAQLLFKLEEEKEIIEYLWRQGVRIVVLKKGAAGVTVGWGNSIVTLPALYIEPVDTTGAGDAFDGAFLYGLLQGYSPFEAAKLGNIVGALMIKGFGAISSLPDCKEVFSLFEQIRNIDNDKGRS